MPARKKLVKKKVSFRKKSYSKRAPYVKRKFVVKRKAASKRKSVSKRKPKRKVSLYKRVIKGKGDYTDSGKLPVTVVDQYDVPDDFVDIGRSGLNDIMPLDPHDGTFINDSSDLNLESIMSTPNSFGPRYTNADSIHNSFGSNSNVMPREAARMLSDKQIIKKGGPVNAYAINPYPNLSLVKQDPAVVAQIKADNAFNNLMSDVDLYKKNEMGLYGKYRNSKFVKGAGRIVPKGTFQTIGGLVGGPLGYLAGSKFAQIAGFGEYRVKKNSLMSEGQTPAYMHSTNSNAVIRHREYIADVVSSATPNAFQNTVYPINPGMANTFPWLSALAQQYQKYRIDGMVFEYKSMYSDAIASSAADGTLGYIIQGTEYNSVLPPFINKQQMDNTEYSTSAKPSVSFYHPIECAPMSIPTDSLYVRSGDPPANADLRLYDLGNFQIATGGVNAASVVLGELWCTYSITLMTPISTFAHGFTVMSDHFQLLGPLGTASPGFLGLDNTPVSGSSIGGKITNNGTGDSVYTFSPQVTDGNYLVLIVMQTSTPPGGAAAPTLSLVNCTGLEMFGVDSNIIVSAGLGVAEPIFMMSFIINVGITIPNAPASITFLGGSWPATVNVTGDLYVTQLDADIVT